MPKSRDLAYIAGFFDGEGWISLLRGCPRVGIAQKDPEILHWVRETLGFGTVRAVGNGYSWRACRREQVKEFARLIHPYSHHREKRRKLRIAYQIIPLMGRRGPRPRSEQHESLIERFYDGKISA